MAETPSFRWLLAFGIGAALLGGAGGLLAARFAGGNDAAIHDYIVGHPEVLPEAMQALRKREDLKALAAVKAEVLTPFPGSVLGNPKGKRTLVEFTDFACGYCRKSVGDVEAMIAADPELRVIVRQLPIISPDSPAAARMGLAAAAQGKYAAFHHAMFAAGRPDAAGIAAAAKAAGLDMAVASRDAADPMTAAEIDRNLEFARALGFNGTPAWVAGERLLTGAVGADALRQALAGG